MVGINRRIVIAAMPEGTLAPENFRMVEDSAPQPGDGEVLVRTKMISIDAANRAWMQGLTYRSALSEGTTMAGLAISEVIESHTPALSTGDIVFGDTGWQDYAVSNAAALTKQPMVSPLTHLLTLYGTSALTAYHGLTEVGALRAGETLAVSAAAGSVGVAVAQIGRLLGARVIGIAGGGAKCRWLVEDLGLDAAVDYRAGDLRAQLKRTVPGGIDVYFDNVGGEILDTALFAMNTHGRVVCCGAISSYDGTKPTAGPRGVPGLLITKRLTMRGFLVDDFRHNHSAALAQLHAWVEGGLLRAIEDVTYGLESAPGALIRQLAGLNRGKQIVVM